MSLNLNYCDWMATRSKHNVTAVACPQKIKPDCSKLAHAAMQTKVHDEFSIIITVSGNAPVPMPVRVETMTRIDSIKPHLPIVSERELRFASERI